MKLSTGILKKSMQAYNMTKAGVGKRQIAAELGVKMTTAGQYASIGKKYYAERMTKARAGRKGNLAPQSVQAASRTAPAPTKVTMPVPRAKVVPEPTSNDLVAHQARVTIIAARALAELSPELRMVAADLATTL